MKFFAIDRTGRILGEYSSVQQLRQAMRYNRIHDYGVMDEEEYREQMSIQQQQRTPSLPVKKSFIPNMIGKNSGRNAFFIPRFDPLKPSKYDRRDEDDEER